MNQIVSLFMFSCGDYEKVKQDVWEENWKAMRLYSVVALVAFGVITLVSVFSLSIGKYKWVYLVYTFLSLAYFCISRCQLRSFLGKELVVYSFFAALLLFGIITGTLITPEELTVNYIVFMMVAPLLFTARTAVMNGLILSSMLLYIGLAFFAEHNPILSKNLADVILYGVLSMLAGCGRQNTSEGKADGSSLEEETSDTWYEIDQEAGILTVRLPAEKEGFIWNFTIDDTTLLELLTQEDNDGTFVASFRALEDGETVVSFSYARDDALEEIRVLNVTCKDGKVAGVSNASVMPISGQDDPEITALRNSNSIPMIMKEHSAVTCVSETWDGENNGQNKTVRQFVSSDGRLWYDYEQYDDADQVVYCEAGYISRNLRI